MHVVLLLREKSGRRHQKPMQRRKPNRDARMLSTTTCDAQKSDYRRRSGQGLSCGRFCDFRVVCQSNRVVLQHKPASTYLGSIRHCNQRSIQRSKETRTITIQESTNQAYRSVLYRLSRSLSVQRRFFWRCDFVRHLPGDWSL